MRDMASSIVTFDSDYIRERAKIVAEAKKLLDDARASLRKAHRHDGWNCKERDAINDSVNDLSSKVDKIGAGLEQLSSKLSGGADRFAELERRAVSQESELSANLLKEYGFEGQNWTPGGNGQESGEVVTNPLPPIGLFPKPKPIFPPPMHIFPIPLPVLPIPPWSRIWPWPIRPPIRIGIPFWPPGIYYTTRPVLREEPAPPSIAELLAAPSASVSDGDNLGSGVASPSLGSSGGEQAASAQSSIGYSYSPGNNAGYNGSYGSYFQGAGSSGSESESLDMMKIIFEWLSKALGMSDSPA
jgi:hypothetical protein